jgi:hypothetical protein
MSRRLTGTYLTGPNFDTGIDLGAGPAFTIAYGTPIINQPGPDLGIITGPLRMPGEARRQLAHHQQQDLIALWTRCGSA